MIKKIKSKVLCFIIMQMFAFTAFAQNVTVKGRITNETGDPLSGASLVVKGANNQGTTTNADGNFSLSVSKGETLMITAIDYSPKEIKISRADLGNISLTRSDKSLGEVVVIGYGTQRKEAITGSVASISGKTLLEVPSTNVTQALQGRLAGVEISQTNSQPGATMQIRVRGQRSLTASNDPLIVLDGIPFVGGIGDINPNDIKVLTF